LLGLRGNIPTSIHISDDKLHYVNALDYLITPRAEKNFSGERRDYYGAIRDRERIQSGVVSRSRAERAANKDRWSNGY